MTFGEFWKLYTEDVKNYVKLNTWLTQEHIVDTKILPYFKNLKMNEITPGDVRKWQNEMVAFRNENGKSYSQTYKKTMHNILSAIFNHACRFYNLKSNPARQAGNMGREEKKEMLFWTTEEYLDGIGIPEIHNSSDVNVAEMDKSITDVTDKSEFIEIRETEPVDKTGWIVRRISELGGYENVSDSVKADIFGFDIVDISGSIRLFSDVMKRLGIKLDGNELYEEFQRIYDESVDRDADKEKTGDKIWNNGRGR